VIVRAATEEDAGVIAGIHVRSWRAAYRGLMPDTYLDSLDPDEWAQRHRGRILIPEPGMTRWVAEREDGSVIAFAALGPARDPSPGPGAGEVYAIYVEPDLRRRGAGRALVAHAVETFRSQGFGTGTLWVLRDNAPARAFYEALGWRFDGAEKDFEVPGFPDARVPEVRYVLPL
jgi:ribosomal protein S18 acetylase RimI-like enzyme